MKKVSLFLISVTLLWGVTKLLQKIEKNHQVFTQREEKIPNQIGVAYKNNEIASFLRTSEKSFQ